MRFLRRSNKVYAAVASLECAAVSCGSPTPTDAIDLSGSWRLAIGDDDQPEGVIELPGTTETREKGPPNAVPEAQRLTRARKFVGPATYQRDFVVPDAWAGDIIRLTLERTKHATIWVDGDLKSASALLSVPQKHDLGPLDPGRHELTIVVDNSRMPVTSEAHLWSDNTQGNWNGILGDIELRRIPSVSIGAVRLDPDAGSRSVDVAVRVQNQTDVEQTVTISLEVQGPTGSVAEQSLRSVAQPGSTELRASLPLGPDAPLWDEFNPSMHRATVTLRAGDRNDSRSFDFGLIDFETHGSQFTANGRPTFLRGTHNGCVFPLTGHPPMTADGWMSYFETCKAYGLNHVRFHTWCPPEAAFEAADRLGVYLQPELPFWGDFTAEVASSLMPEAEAILETYGNHPSFVMFTLGNEHWGGREELAKTTSRLRSIDADRRLYAHGSNSFMWDPLLEPTEDFVVSTAIKNRHDGPARLARGGQPTFNGETPGHVQTGPPSTRKDYSEAIEGIDGPVVSHEMGQWSICPDFSEISKYSDVLRPRNLERFQDRLRDAGLLHLAHDFQRASGALAVRLYREDIEACVRTDGHGGFQLLDLQDFPGQGTALVGILDAFMDDKGLITHEAWRSFCAPVVILARFDKYVWMSTESFKAEIQIAHYGPARLSDAVFDWRIETPEGVVINAGSFGPMTVDQGGVRSIGQAEASLETISAPTELKLEIESRDRTFHTQYPLWAFPAIQRSNPPATVMLTSVYDDAARRALEAGGRVVLCLSGERVMLHSPGGGFATDFWNWPMFHNPPGTMGMLIDDDHFALAGFPTSFHSDWQWDAIARNAQPLDLGVLPEGIEPIVRTIDNIERNLSLSTIFEVRVGNGRLLVCASPLPELADDHPEAAALLRSLLAYADSTRFDPRVEVGSDTIDRLMRTTVPMFGEASASSEVSEWPIHVAKHAADRNVGTHWQASADRDAGQDGVVGVVGSDTASARADGSIDRPWWSFTFASPVACSEIELLWPADGGRHGYAVQISRDDGLWGTLTTRPAGDSRGSDSIPLGRTQEGICAIRVLFDRLTSDTDPPAIRELRLVEPLAR